MEGATGYWSYTCRAPWQRGLQNVYDDGGLYTDNIMEDMIDPGTQVRVTVLHILRIGSPSQGFGRQH